MRALEATRVHTRARHTFIPVKPSSHTRDFHSIPTPFSFAYAMQPISGDDFTAALQLLADAAVDREHEISKYSAEAENSDTDDDNDSDPPIFDQFYDRGGSAGIISMTNYTPDELLEISDCIRAFVIYKYTRGRGRRSSINPQDFFMTLRVLKHGGHWDFMARTFGMKGPTFERLIVVLGVSEFIYKN